MQSYQLAMFVMKISHVVLVVCSDDVTCPDRHLLSLLRSAYWMCPVDFPGKAPGAGKECMADKPDGGGSGHSSQGGRDNEEASRGSTGTGAKAAAHEGCVAGSAPGPASSRVDLGSGASRPKFVFVWNMVPDSSLSALHGAFFSLPRRGVSSSVSVRFTRFRDGGLGVDGVGCALGNALCMSPCVSVIKMTLL